MNPVVIGSIFNALGYAVGGLLYWHEAKRRKLATDGMSRIVLIGAVAGVLLSRLAERLAEGGNYASLFDPSNGGRTILGGVIGGWIAVEIAKRKMGIRTSTGPLWAVALPAGEFFGRIGCWFNGCCFGKVCTLPWAVNSHDAMRHPTQFYLAASAALIFGVVWWGSRSSSSLSALFGALVGKSIRHRVLSRVSGSLTWNQYCSNSLFRALCRRHLFVRQT